MGAGAGGNFGNTKGSRSNAQIHQGRQDKHILKMHSRKSVIRRWHSLMEKRRLSKK